MAASFKYLIEGEQNRVLILDYLKGKELTGLEIAHGVDMTKTKVENYLRSLLRSGHIAHHRTTRNKFVYKRTTKKFITMNMQDRVHDNESDLDQMMPDVVVPHARVVRLLSNPLPSPPTSKKRSSMYGTMQSGMTMFGLE